MKPIIAADGGSYRIAPVPGSDQLVDVVGVLAWIRRQWPFMVAGLMLGLLMALLYLRTATYTYTVTMKVTPVENPQSASSGRLSQLANIAGVNLANLSGGESNFELFLDGLTSRRTAVLLAQDAGMMRRLLPDHWSDADQRWVRPRNFANVVRDFGDSMLGRRHEPYRGPTAADIQHRLSRIVKVAQGRDSVISIVTVNVEDPDFGRELLLFLSRASNSDLQEKSRSRSQAYIDYLEDAVARTTIAEQRAAYVQILSDQAKILMIASSGLPYAADLVEPPFASRRPTLPNPVLILLLGALGGAFLGLMAAVALPLRFGSREPAEPSALD